MVWTAWLPAAFVVVSLFVLLVAPLLLEARVSAIRSGLVDPAQRARGEVNTRSGRPSRVVRRRSGDCC